MDSYADMGCLLKVNAHCDACKMKMMEILSSICGVYSVTIDAEEGTAKITGEVDPNTLLRALARSGRHAEVVWVKLKHPVVSRNYYENNDSYNNNNTYGYNNYGAIEEPYNNMYRRGLPERSGYDTHQNYPIRRSAPDYPFHPSNYYYGSMALPARHRNYYL